MWSKEISIKSLSSKEQIWNLWTNVSNWNLWDDQIMSSKIHGAFKMGQTGELIPARGPKSTFKLIEVTKQKSFTSRSTLPLSTMDVIHEMREAEGELIITHRVEISGVLSFVFSKLIGNKIIKHLPNAMNELSNIALKGKI